MIALRRGTSRERPVALRIGASAEVTEAASEAAGSREGIHLVRPGADRTGDDRLGPERLSGGMYPQFRTSPAASFQSPPSGRNVNRTR